MKKIIALSLLLITLATFAVTLTSCSKDCTVCDGRGQVKDTDCYYYKIGYGTYFDKDMAEIYHYKNCDDPKCTFNKFIDCESCNGTGRVKK